MILTCVDVENNKLMTKCDYFVTKSLNIAITVTNLSNSDAHAGSVFVICNHREAGREGQFTPWNLYYCCKKSCKNPFV